MKKQNSFMRVIHHLYKRVLLQRLSNSERRYASENKNVRMAIGNSLLGVICGPTVTVQGCGGAIKHRVFKCFKVVFLLTVLSAIN